MCVPSRSVLSLLAAGMTASVLAGCDVGSTTPVAASALPAAGETVPVPTTEDGDPLDCQAAVAPPVDATQVSVVLAAADTAGLRRTLQTVAGDGGVVLLASYGSGSGEVDEKLVAGLDGQGPNGRIAAANAQLRQRCFTYLASEAALSLPGRSGAALSAIRDAAAIGASHGTHVRLAVHGAGTAQDTGLDVTKADLSDGAVVSNLVRDIIDGGILSLPGQAQVEVVFLDVDDEAENGLVAAHRRAFFDQLCAALTTAAACSVQEVL